MKKSFKRQLGECFVGAVVGCLIGLVDCYIIGKYTITRKAKKEMVLTDNNTKVKYTFKKGFYDEDFELVDREEFE